MHEWALADAVITTAKKVAKEENLIKVTEIVVKIGELQTISKEIFDTALQHVLKDAPELFEKVECKLEIEPAGFKCMNCGHEWLFGDVKKNLDDDETESIHFIPETAHVFLKCPVCKSPDFEIAKGRGIWVDSIEGEK